MAERAVHINDVLPPVAQVDPEVKVTRQMGVTLEQAALQDPYANLPVVQVDPEVTVTRQKGIVHLDAGAGMVRVDQPAPPRYDKDTPAAARMGRLVADAAIAPSAKERVVPGVPESVVPSFHQPLQGGLEKVSRVGIRTEKQAEAYLKPVDGILKADQRAPGVQIAERPVSPLPPEQVEAFRRGKPFPADAASKAAQPVPVDFWAQQGEWKEPPFAKEGVVQASMRSAASGKPAVAPARAPKKAKAKRGKARTRAGRQRALTGKQAEAKVQAQAEPVAPVRAESPTASVGEEKPEE